jgi:soluble lytic murein transglycosylase-like protein
VPNSEGSGAAGLLQLMPGWYNGSYYDFPDFNPYDAYLNLYYGRKGWEESGWTPWAI